MTLMPVLKHKYTTTPPEQDADDDDDGDDNNDDDGMMMTMIVILVTLYFLTLSIRHLERHNVPSSETHMCII